MNFKRTIADLEGCPESHVSEVQPGIWYGDGGVHRYYITADGQHVAFDFLHGRWHFAEIWRRGAWARIGDAEVCLANTGVAELEKIFRQQGLGRYWPMVAEELAKVR